MATPVRPRPGVVRLRRISDFASGLRKRRAIDEALAAWLRPQAAAAAAGVLSHAGIPAAALASSVDLADSAHLRERGFWDRHGAGALPGLPWRAGFGRAAGPAPGLGADTDAVLRQALDLSVDEIAQLRRAGALG